MKQGETHNNADYTKANKQHIVMHYISDRTVSNQKPFYKMNKLRILSLRQTYPSAPFFFLTLILSLYYFFISRMTPKLNIKSKEIKLNNICMIQEKNKKKYVSAAYCSLHISVKTTVCIKYDTNGSAKKHKAKAQNDKSESMTYI